MRRLPHAPALHEQPADAALGFTPPSEHSSFSTSCACRGHRSEPRVEDEKGTGYYKVPSLKGVWYRGRYLHDGSLTTLEEMFDPARLRDDYAPTGFMPPGEKTRAIPVMYSA